MINLDFDNLPSEQFSATVLTIGNFDGVHAGHQELIKRAVAASRERKMKSVVITFDPHPAIYFKPNLVPSPICSRKCKEKFIAALGADALLTLTFDERLAQLNPEEYVQNILLEKLNAKVVWVGYDFTFGRNRSGNVRQLIELGEQYGFQTYILEPQRIEGIVVSSTRIREFLTNGMVEDAAKLLRRRHVIQGIVVGGDAEGRKLGFPTINLEMEDGLVPKAGIYSGIALVEGTEYAAAIYIGYRPTHGGDQLRVEAHLLGFSGNLYQKKVPLAFLKFQRDDIKFENQDELKSNIQLDCQRARQDFEEVKKDPNRISVAW